MEIESNTNNPSSALIKKEKQCEVAHHEGELPLADTLTVIIVEPPINDISQSFDNQHHYILRSEKCIKYPSKFFYTNFDFVYKIVFIFIGYRKNCCYYSRKFVYRDTIGHFNCSTIICHIPKFTY